MNIVSRFFAGAALAAGMGVAGAAEPALDMALVDAQIRNTLKVYLPSLTADTIAETPIPGIYEVTFGSRIVYTTADGRYLIQGKLADLETGAMITDDRQQVLKAAALSGVPESEMIVFGKDDAEYQITVFTDIDCGYCRKLHAEMDAYNKAGIRVRYLAFPRGGQRSEAYGKAVSVWCSDDRHAAMDAAKTGQALEPRSCDNPVMDQYNLGREMGVQGTPAIVLDDGEMIPGYVPADRLKLMLAQKVVDQQAR